MAETRQQQAPKLGRYDFTAIEARWQRFWAERGTFRTLNPGETGFDGSRPKFYVLDMFPYPSGSGLHVGHPVGYCATDIVARYKRMRGCNVLHPMGFDAFGLPAEQYAIEHNVHPAVTTRKNIDRYREQLRMFGFSYDWERELATCDATYYKFTQWIFLRMFESWYDAEGGEETSKRQNGETSKRRNGETAERQNGETARPDTEGSTGREPLRRARPIRELLDELESGRWGVGGSLDLIRERGIVGRREWADLSNDERRRVIDRHRLAYVDEVPVNWCPALGTVLANEEVTNEGRSDRGDHPVYRRPLRQWMLRITAYADRLLSDLEGLDWPEPIKLMQRNWIGKSTGAEVVFPLANYWRIAHGEWVRVPAPADHCSQSSGTPDDPSSLRRGSDAGVSNRQSAIDNRQSPIRDHAIRVYTTRPDTLFGATYMVLAPEHELVEAITTKDRRAEVEAYVAAARHRSDLDRTADNKEKTGVFTGAYAINPVNGERIPIWVADYVLMGYGTGAIMAVPGGDTRDFEFACKFDLPIVTVVKPPVEWIEERVAEMAGRIDAAAESGFGALQNECPELRAEIAERRKRSAGLGERTERTLKDRVGVERLVEHYVRHARSWGAAYTGAGIAVQSPGGGAPAVPGGACSLDGLPTSEAKTRIIEWLERNGVGRRAVNYKLRDWIFSRQKYWGEPFPVLHGEDGETIGVGEDELPVELPEMSDFKPTPSADKAETLPEPPLGRAKEWVNVQRDGRRFRRDLNTMPQWAGSCWYYLRFIDPTNSECFCDAQAERYWMPIDLYVGGAEHAVLHLLYARFWHKVLFDLGFVSTREPFGKLFNQGMIQSFAFRDPAGRILSPEAVEERGEDRYFARATGEGVTRIVAKMSKALKNVVNPDEIIRDCGADTFRLYEMYMGPLDASKPWNTRDVPGLFKLCQRVWRLVVDENTGELASALCDATPDGESLRALHKFLKRVTEDLEALKLNTAIAAVFDFVNFLTPRDRRSRAVVEPFVLAFSPFAPHLCEELWHRLGHADTLAYEPWPAYDEKLVRDEEVEIGVQINGKMKARVLVPADADEEFVKKAALAEGRVVAALSGLTLRKVVVVKGRLVNIVAN